MSKGWLEIELDEKRERPVRMDLMVLTGIKGAAPDGKEHDPKRDIAEEEHIVFTFRYSLDQWDAVDRFVIPPEAQKLLK